MLYVNYLNKTRKKSFKWRDIVMEEKETGLNLQRMETAKIPEKQWSFFLPGDNSDSWFYKEKVRSSRTPEPKFYNFMKSHELFNLILMEARVKIKYNRT